jgi:hypothetical protein
MSERDILSAVEARNNAKMSRDFDEADRLRDQLRAAGITVDDKARMWTAADGRSGDIPSGGGFARGDRKLDDGSLSWENTIYVAGLPEDVSTEEIAAFFGQVPCPRLVAKAFCSPRAAFFASRTHLCPVALSFLCADKHFSALSRCHTRPARPDQEVKEELQPGRADDSHLQGQAHRAAQGRRHRFV